MLSLRSQLLFGAILWTVGLFVVAIASMALVWVYLPAMPFLGRTGTIHYWVHHTGPLFAVAVIFMAAGLFRVRRGLSGITQLRDRLGAVHNGRDARVEGQYVPEVQPLVDDLNALLDHSDKR